MLIADTYWCLKTKRRCATAVCAVKLMGDLSEKYGFFPMNGEWVVGKEVDGKTAVDDAGEAVTLADATGDAWIFHVVGGIALVNPISCSE